MKPLHNALCQRLGVRWPLIQAPMAGVQDSALALAVSGAGGLGSLPGAMLSADALRDQVQRLHASGLPYNLNFFCHQPPEPDAARQAQWQAALAPYGAELGLPPAEVSGAASRQPFSAETAALLAPFKPPVLSFHFGLPAAPLLAQVKAWGAFVLASATTVEEALWLQAHGADAVIAQGLEAGGHRGHFLSDELSRQMGTLALLPQVVAAVQVPVIAAGGLVDAAGVRAALALGAAGVQVGTAYLCADEAQTSPLHRAALQSPQAQHTALTNVFTGRPARGIVNRLMREQGQPGQPGLFSPLAPAFPLAGNALAPLRAAAEQRGSTDFSPLWCGQNASACRSAPAADITRDLAQAFGQG